MSPDALTAALKAEAARLGFDLSGATPAIAPPQIERLRQWLSDGFAGEMHSMAARAGAYEHPRHVLPGVRSLLMLAVSYGMAEPGTGSFFGPGTMRSMVRPKNVPVPLPARGPSPDLPGARTTTTWSVAACKSWPISTAG